MENNRQDPHLNRYILLGIITILSSFLMWSLIEFFTAFLAAVMFYVLSKPSIDWLISRYRWSKAAIASLVIVVSFFIILLPLGLFATMLYGKIASVLQHPDTALKPFKHLGEMVEQKYHINIIKSSIGSIREISTKLFSSVINTSFDFFATISMMYFFLYFMIGATGRMEAALMLFLPFKRSQMKLFGEELKTQTISNAVGVPLIAVVHGLLALTIYLIVKADDPGFWAVATGFASIIPLVGTSLIWMPIAAYLLIQGQIWQGLVVVGWGFLIIGTSDNLIRFLLAKKIANIHPIITVLGVILGLKYFGLTGLIFGPLIISYVLILLKIYYIEFLRPAALARMNQRIRDTAKNKH